MLGRSNSVGRYIAPVRERGLKYVQSNSRAENIFAPVRERGLKLSSPIQLSIGQIAPVRERGLKSSRPDLPVSG